MLGIFRWFASLFTINTSESIVNSVLESVTGLRGESKTEYLKAKTQYLSACQPFNVARRFIAIMFTLLYIFGVIFTAVLHYFSPQYAAFLGAIVKNDLQMSMNLIIGFYFAVGGMSKIGEFLRK